MHLNGFWNEEYETCVCCDQGSLPGGGELMIGTQRKGHKVEENRTGQAEDVYVS